MFGIEHAKIMVIMLAAGIALPICGCAAPHNRGGSTVNESCTATDGAAATEPSTTIQTGTPDTVSAMMVFDDGTGSALYIAIGAYDGTWTDSHMYRWTGRAWHDLGELPDRSVSNFFVLGGTKPNLHAVVHALGPDGAVQSQTLVWNGLRWSPAELELKGRIGTTIVFDDGRGSGPVEYAAGLLEFDGLEGYFGIARFDGRAWSPLLEPADGERVYNVGDMEVFDDCVDGPMLVVAGSFSRDGLRGRSAIAQWTGQSWRFIRGGGFEGGCQAAGNLAVFRRPGEAQTLVTAGSFTHVNGTASGGVAAMRGRVWTDLNGGIDGAGAFKEIYSMCVLDDARAGAGRAAPSLYVAGNFRQIGSVPANFVARWDGAKWHGLGDGLESPPQLIVFDDGSGPALYAGGSFKLAGGKQVNHLAKWTGREWQALTGPVLPEAKP